jgi:hypothetical protein
MFSAIVERRLFGITQAHVMVAILIQPFFSGHQVRHCYSSFVFFLSSPSFSSFCFLIIFFVVCSHSQVLANGVGITRNPFRNDYPAHFLNVQVSGRAVTDGQGTPEQLLVYDEGKPVCEIISRSSENKGMQEGTLFVLHFILLFFRF